jgi:hypothetical protein
MLYFFHHLPTKASDKHKLQTFARETYGINLEVMDCKGISELLADPETVWIAERYLSLPSAFILARTSDSDAEHWYKDLLEASDDEPLTDGIFFKLKDAIREVAYTSELRSDALKLFAKIRRYRAADSERIRRKAIYEEFVASLRGLGDSVGYEDDLRNYLSTLNSLTEPADLEDAAVIISYILGARVNEGLPISLPEIEVWHEQLSQNVTAALASTEHPPRKCALMLCKASLQLSKGMFLASIDYAEREKYIRSAAGDALSTWRKIIALSNEAPLFPIERIANFADAIAVLLEEVPENSKFQAELDKVLSQRSGQRSSIQRRLKRASAFQVAGKKLRALQELHQAQVDAINAEDAVLFTLFLAKIYSDLGLHFAAKHYALSSAYAALRLPDEDLRSLAYAGCAEAAASDYASGGSLMFFLTAEVFMLLAQQYSMRGTGDKREFEWKRIDYHLFQVTYWSFLISSKLQSELISRLDDWSSKEIYEAMLPLAGKQFENIKTLEGLAEKTTPENICPFFSDAGERRQVTWTQLQIDWEVNWPNVYDAARFAESFCAYLQIILAELTDLELSILPGKAKVEIRFGDDKNFKFEDVADNHSVSRKLHIPPVSQDSQKETDLAVSAVFMFLNSLSAEKQDVLLEILKERIAERMPKIFSAYAPNSRLFEEFYLKEDYERLYKFVEATNTKQVLPHLDGDQELSGPTGLHPNYETKDFHDQIMRRYQRTLPIVKYTLARLRTEPEFNSTILSLRSEGWKDWHILLAIANARTNFLYGYKGNTSPDEHFKKEFMQKFNEPELEGDPVIPSKVFSLRNLKQALEISQLTTLSSLGFEVRQKTPNFEGADALLRRLNYWTDDLEHEDVFESTGGRVAHF